MSDIGYEREDHYNIIEMEPVKTQLEFGSTTTEKNREQKIGVEK